MRSTPAFFTVAGDTIAHNSIEQDSDLVLFISCEANSDLSGGDGVAEIMIGKQRNGMTGSFQLSFRKRITKFSDLQKERY